MTYDPNPERGCGRKREGYYIESGPGSPAGRLSLVTLMTGDLIDGGENLLCSIPPRGVHRFYPTDSMRMGEVQLTSCSAKTPDGRVPMEQVWLNGTKRVGLIDHVGSNHYSPISFIKELHEHGASRRVTQEMALEVNSLMKILGGSVPIFFTHSDIPLFFDTFSALQATEAACALWGVPTDKVFYPASYMHKNWGMRRTRWGGIWEDVPAAAYYILAMIDDAKTGDDERYAAARETVGGDRCVMQEQLLCASWIRQVSYATETGEVPQEVIDYGLTVVDIGDEEE